MKRDFLFSCYQTPRGKLLQEAEAQYLQRSITVSCQQTLLQIGGLGWESDFIDGELYKNYTILDAKKLGYCTLRKIQGKAYCLPLKCDSVDMIIVPHLLEFDEYRFQTMREIERVLKPEGLLIIINFNPWSLWVRYQYLWDKKLADSWNAHFIARSRVLDWLKLLNFEVISASDFMLDNTKHSHGKSISRNCALSANAYAIKAIKRRYNLIPLTPVKNFAQSLAIANAAAFTQNEQHDE
ncbi:MAG: methyltransferase domain-containing protein [Methylococcaceae bacterium]